MAKANEKAVMIKARANEEAERAIADAKTRAERVSVLGLLKSQVVVEVECVFELPVVFSESERISGVV